MSNKNALSSEQQVEILGTLKKRFEKNKKRHPEIHWDQVLTRLEAHPAKLNSLHLMEATDGEPDVVGYDENTDEYIFYDCATESPKGRRSLCYDREAHEARKEYKPENNAIDVAAAMDIELLNEEQYRKLQELGEFDLKTSSWLKTPDEIRKFGGAIFGDRRYNHVFVYHNGVQSYYAARGFRGVLKV